MVGYICYHRKEPGNNKITRDRTRSRAIMVVVDAG
jgi:hypothetical protein